MAHGLEQIDGTVSFALRGAPAWHGLANRVFGDDEDVSTSQMLDAALLSNWDVRMVPCEATMPDGWRSNLRSENHYVLRTNPVDGGVDALGIVGGGYMPQSNESNFDTASAIVDSGDAKWEAAGSISEGRKVFGSLLLPREIVLDPGGSNDHTKLYLLVSSSHDGTLATQFSITPTRVVCQNTLNIALRGVKQSYKIKHTINATAKIAQAREALGMAYRYFDTFETEVQALFDTQITNAQFYALVDTLYAKPEEDVKGALTKWENKRDLIGDIYFKSPTQDNIRGTLWGAVNALTERIDYFRNVRKDGREASLAGASGFDPLISAEKDRIFAHARQLVSI